MSVGYQLFCITFLLTLVYWIACGILLATYRRLHLKTGLGASAPSLFDPSPRNTIRILSLIFGGDAGKIGDVGLMALMYLTRLLFIAALASLAASIWTAFATL